MEGLDVEAVARHPLVSDLAGLAAAVAAAPMGAVCLVDRDRRWHVAADGVDAARIPRTLAALGAAHEGVPLVVPDASADDRLSSDRQVELLGLAGCAATPVADPEGEVIGCVLALDTRLRSFDRAVLEKLAALARQVERHIDRAVEQHHLRDLSIRLVESESELSQTLERLEASNRDLEHFAYYVAHELQAPLHAVRIFAELLHDAAEGAEIDPELIATAADGVGTEAERLGEKVSSLFALSQFSTQRPGAPVALAPALDEVAATLADTLSAPEVSCDPGVKVLAERAALQTLLTNLLSNAARYRHPDRELAVRIDVTRDDGMVRVEVVDNGVGIAPADVGRIFEAFQRLDPSGPGAGVGLALCRRIVEGFGGRIAVSSELGVGTTFTVHLVSA